MSVYSPERDIRRVSVCVKESFSYTSATCVCCTCDVSCQLFVISDIAVDHVTVRTVYCKEGHKRRVINTHGRQVEVQVH